MIIFLLMLVYLLPILFINVCILFIDVKTERDKEDNKYYFLASLVPIINAIFMYYMVDELIRLKNLKRKNK